MGDCLWSFFVSRFSPVFHLPSPVRSIHFVMRLIHFDKADAWSAPTDVGLRAHWRLLTAEAVRQPMVDATASTFLSITRSIRCSPSQTRDCASVACLCCGSFSCMQRPSNDHVLFTLVVVALFRCCCILQRIFSGVMGIILVLCIEKLSAANPRYENRVCVQPGYLKYVRN